VRAKQEAVIWAAGFFDGEGCISIYKQQQGTGGKVYYGMKISACQAYHKASLEELCELFGGSVRPDKYGWRWVACGPTATAALSTMLPHLRVKRGQAEVAIPFQARRIAIQECRPADFCGEQDEADYLELRRLKRVVV
jgi:hypothetical protein